MIDFRLGRHVLGVEVLRSQAVLVVKADVPAGEVTGAAAARRAVLLKDSVVAAARLTSKNERPMSAISKAQHLGVAAR